MKKVIIILIALLLLSSCQDTSDASLKLYNEMIDMIENCNDFHSKTEFFSSTFEVTMTSDGQRYYIVIDNPSIAMYGVSILAFEEGSDIENEFAPNAGVFDEKINIVPNQINKENGYVKGISISGISTSDNPTVYCLVQWKDENNSKVYREYLKFAKESN